ncbi:MAG: hypothetical protein AAGE84_06815 [Cyanobacteria bacterium P01_G01_bin.39]
MTTTSISIQDLVQREVIYCVSSLVHTLTQENKLDEELAISLWEGPISFDNAEYAINQDGSYLDQKDNLWGLYDNDDADNPIVDYEYESKEELIKWYFEDMGWDLNDYRSEVFEHWIVTSWLGKKLQEHDETVVEDVLGIAYIWCRTTTGQAIHCDCVIQQIYNELISK